MSTRSMSDSSPVASSLAWLCRVCVLWFLAAAPCLWHNEVVHVHPLEEANVSKAHPVLRKSVRSDEKQLTLNVLVCSKSSAINRHSLVFQTVANEP